MRVTTWAQARLRRLRQDDPEAGFTLLEVMISMVLMTFFMVLFTAAITQMFSMSNKVDAVTESSSQINVAFERIDKQVRYASSIDAPNTVKAPGGWYVEFVNTASGTDVCYQLRVSGSQLQERSWTGTPALPPRWVPLASNVVMPASTPFTFSPAAGSQTAQRLKLSISSTSSTDSRTSATSQTVVTFEAMNSGQGTSTTNDGTTLVCQNAGDGGRP